MTEHDLRDRLYFAHDAAQEAGRITLDHFSREDLAVERKEDDSPVTAADRAAENLLRERIAGHYPRDGILGEEFGEIRGRSGYRWILDPIDGTKSFIRGVPLYGTLVGLERDGDPVLGVIHLPALGETVFAARGHGAWWTRGNADPVPARVSLRRTLDEALFCATSVSAFERRGAREVFDRLQARSRLTRTWGDCYGYALVATGRAEVMIDPGMSVWDAAALLPVLEEAGGTFTDWKGNPTVHGGEGLATNGHVLAGVLAVTAGSAR